MTDPIETALLARLLVKSRRAPSERDVVNSLRPFFEDADGIRDRLARLEREGAVQERALTSAGRERACAALGLKGSKVPTEWRALKHILVQLALGKKTKTASALRATALATKLGIETGASPSESQVIDAWAARELGMPGQRLTLANVRAHALSRALGIAALRNPKSIGTIASAKVLGVPRTDANTVRDAVLRDWIRAAAPKPRAFELSEFASAVKELARGTEDGRFGRYNVFIAPIWERARSEAAFGAMSESEFKAKLVEAHRARLLHLTRADLTPAMPAAMVAASEVSYLNAVFHFVDLEGPLS